MTSSEQWIEVMQLLSHAHSYTYIV